MNSEHLLSTFTSSSTNSSVSYLCNFDEALAQIMKRFEVQHTLIDQQKIIHVLAEALSSETSSFTSTHNLAENRRQPQLYMAQNELLYDYVSLLAERYWFRSV